MSEVPSLVDLGLYDPWDPRNIDPTQSNRLRAYVTVELGSGQYSADVTSRLDPHLIMVRLITGTELSDYQCEIELDDRDGRLPIPPIDAPLNISFGWKNEGSAMAWQGRIHDIEHGFGRKQGGRRMWIHGYGGTMIGPAKAPRNSHLGEGAKEGEEGPKIPLSAFLIPVANAAGQDLQVHSKFDGPKYQRDYWNQGSESYYHLAMRLAEEMGALFRVKEGTNGQFTVQGENIDGTPTPAIQAVWGKNLIAWRVRPLSTRTQWGEFSQHYFDISKGMWNQATQQSNAKAPFNFASAGFQASQPAPNAGQADGGNAGEQDGVAFANGPGRIVINGEPDAQGNCYVQLSGARPGVDGIYWCPTVEHIYSRQGYVTWLDVKAVQVSAAEYTRYQQTGITQDTPIPLPQPRPQLSNIPGGGTTSPE